METKRIMEDNEWLIFCALAALRCFWLAFWEQPVSTSLLLVKTAEAGLRARDAQLNEYSWSYRFVQQTENAAPSAGGRWQVWLPSTASGTSATRASTDLYHMSGYGDVAGHSKEHPPPWERPAMQVRRRGQGKRRCDEASGRRPCLVAADHRTSSSSYSIFAIHLAWW